SLPRATVAACPPLPPRLAPPADRPRYALRVDVRPRDRVAEGTVEVRFTPDIDTDRLVFRLWPNGPRQAAAGARMETGPVHVDGREVAATLESPTMLVVPVATGAGRTVVASVPWTLTLPGPIRDRIAVEGDAVRLGSFFPILEWEPGVGWNTRPPTSQFSEASTAPTADFDLTVTTPAGFGVVATGMSDRPGHWTATAVRDVAVAVGRFTVVTGTANAPDPVQVTVGVHAGIDDAPADYLRQSVAVLEDFGRRFGAYPWSTFSVSVTPTLRSGIEYPTHVMHGPDTLGATLTHEIGHQWFYGLVGNNQARDPWLDEGLAMWTEATGQGALARYRARAVPPEVRGRLGEPMTYWDPRSSVFFAGVYLQGLQAVAALGPAELVDCALRVFVAQNAYRIATPGDFFAAAAAVFPGPEATLAQYGLRP
ncbi:MAG: hypothetical protein M3O23_03880, partial [Actinomycetota bacterium]|nr:hypothetical protein [Actinomycetota bacterium]